jgi:hypothetical protein
VQIESNSVPLLPQLIAGTNLLTFALRLSIAAQRCARLYAGRGRIAAPLNPLRQCHPASRASDAPAGRQFGRVCQVTREKKDVIAFALVKFFVSAMTFAYSGEPSTARACSGLSNQYSVML